MFLFFVELALAIAAGILLVPVIGAVAAAAALLVGAIASAVSGWADRLGQSMDRIIAWLRLRAVRTGFRPRAQ